MDKIELIKSVGYAVIWASSFVGWLFFFSGAGAFTLALMDSPLAFSLQLGLFIGTLVNSFFMSTIVANRVERLFWNRLRRPGSTYRRKR